MANLFGGGGSTAKPATPPGIDAARAGVNDRLKKRGMAGRAAALLVSAQDETAPATAQRTVTGS